MADLDFGMDRGSLKQLLVKSKQEPVNCAMGKGKDASLALLRLDKTKQPRKLESDLAKDYADLKDPRFGTAHVDLETDPKLVIFRVNKPAGGMPKRVLKVVKLAGFSKVRFEYEDGSPADEDAEEEEAAAVPAAAAAPVEAPAPDFHALTARLTGAVQRIPQALARDASQRDTLLGLARQGQTLIAAQNHGGALAAIESLEIALEAPAARSAEAMSETAGAVSYAKARLAWVSTRKMLETELEKLREQMIAFYMAQDETVAEELSRNFNARVEPMLVKLDDTLADLLDDATNATDPEKRAAIVAEAKATIKAYQDYVSGEQLFKVLDNNPFTKLNITPTVTKTLAALSVAVH